MSDTIMAPAPRGAILIAHQLQQAIVGGVYANREQLPPERQLAVDYHASRATVRKALLWLEAQKLVERRAGSGTYVTFEANIEDSDDLAGIVSPLELIEVRAIIEPQMARLAVMHASGRDVEKLHTWFEALQVAEDEGDPNRYSIADEQFHLAIAASASNPLLSWLYKQINAIRTHAQWSEMKHKVLTAQNMAIYNKLHAEVLQAVRERDAAAAQTAMNAHMEKARDDLVGAHSR
jgi:DNA-binding FadR family transcriptional regulator